MKIFFIEKDQFVRKTFEIIFKKNDHDIYCVNEFGDFSFIIEDLSPDCIIIDMDTISEDADSFLEMLNQNSKLKSIPIWVIGNSEKFHACKKLEKESQVFIEKPFSPLDLFLKLTNSFAS